MTSVASVSPRLISAVSPEPARLLAAAAAELVSRWTSGNYDLDELDGADLVADVGRIRDGLGSLTGLFEPGRDTPGGNLYDRACELAGDGVVSDHAGSRAAEARTALARAAGELGRALDRSDLGFGS